MMKRNKRALSLLLVTLLFSTNVYAGTNSTNDIVDVELENLLIEDGLENEIDNIIVLDEGVYQVGDVVYVDASVETASTGEIIPELSNDITPYGTTYPSSVWNWNNGSYRTSFDIDGTHIFTNYKFTGYGQYYIDTNVTLNTYGGSWPGGGTWKIECADGGRVVTEYSSSKYSQNVTVRFYNLNAGSQYAFVIRKANDGTNIRGPLTISH